MLSRLSIRDVVLIEKLDLDFAGGLCAFTGETGAGKSILLDSLALATGARADSSLVRHGAKQLSVSAEFVIAGDSPVFAILDEAGVDIECRRFRQHGFRSFRWCCGALFPPTAKAARLSTTNPSGRR